MKTTRLKIKYEWISLFLFIQEMVNLILTGKAASNVFNDIMELDSGGGEISILRGIQGRSEIGLLSLFEHYGSCKVRIKTLITLGSEMVYQKYAP